MAESNTASVSFLKNLKPSSPDAQDIFLNKTEYARNLNGLSPAMKRRLTKFLRGKSGVESKQYERGQETSYEIFAVATPPYSAVTLAKLYEISPYHHGAVDAKVSNVVGLGYDFIESPLVREKLDEESGKKKIKAMRRKISRERRKLTEAIDGLNEDAFLTQTLVKVITDYETTGNGYIEIGRTISGEIGYVGHIPATTMRVRIQRDGYVQIVGHKVTFFRNYGDEDTSDPIGTDPNPNEIIHLKNYSPTSAFYGVPDIVAAKSSVAGNEFAQRFNLDYFEHKAVPRYVITLKGAKLSPEDEKKMLEFFETNLKGQNHRSVFIPLPPDEPNRKVEFKMDAVESGIQDGSFERYQLLNRDQILMAHRVPVSKIGIPEGQSLAIARDADKTFKEQVCGPLQRTIEKKLAPLIKEFTDILIFKLNELALVDEDTQSSIDEKYLRNKVITPNEVRARKGIPGIEGGDTVIDLSAKQTEQAIANAGKTSERDADRSSNNPDISGNARQPKGEGRAQQ